MSKKSPLGEITPSICEAAFNEYVDLDDSLAKLIQENCIEVRDFIILSFVCDQGELSAGQIAQILGIGLDKTRCCIGRLKEAGLIEISDSGSKSDEDLPIRLTSTGHKVTLRIHGYQD